MSKIYKSARSTFALFLVILTILGFAYELYDIQIVNAEYFISQNSSTSTYTVSIPASRGEIVDRNGNPLVTNRQGNSIILDAAYFPSSSENTERNAIILNLINLFDENGEEYVHNLPLKITKKGNIKFFTESDDSSYESMITTMKSKDMLNLQSYATAENCFDAMIEKYGLEDYLEIYGAEVCLEIGNIRYELTRLSFSVSNPVTIAEDVSDETVALIKEDSDSFLGADVQVVAYREYSDSTLAAHIIGTVRKINAEEYAELKDSGYGITDEIGESGIEKAMEDYLRGTPGEKTVTIDADGNVTEEITKEPIQGDTIVLTIDKDLQKLAENKLKKICNSISYLSTGAVVVENVNNGEILAAANYPTYDLEEYYSNYSELANDSLKPLYNRFAQGTYAPGSTFKPLMACAALEEGIITSSSTFYCNKTYDISDMTFKCTKTHGTESVTTALRDSCNVFFYNCGHKLGIELMNQYATAFGLGQKTGVEIPEASGVLAGPEYLQQYDEVWHPGDTVQAAIGQSYNLFTPLQLCNYCATIANGGTLYQMHFVKSIISSETGSVTSTGTTVLSETGLSASTISTVKSGMRLVATEGAPRTKFSKLDVEVAAKTGTSQVVVDGVKHNNGFLITFAPYSNPEIAVASAIELAGSGTSTASITASLINYYYSNTSNAKTAQDTSTLL